LNFHCGALFYNRVLHLAVPFPYFDEWRPRGETDQVKNFTFSQSLCLKLDHTYSIFPLGDSAITLDLGNRIDEELNRKALAIREYLLSARWEGITDIIVSYSAISVLYDPIVVRKQAPAVPEAFGRMRARLEEACRVATAETIGLEAPVRIPVCYEPEFGPDLPVLCEMKRMSPEELVSVHSSGIYRVYMIGFLPGFAYLGKMDQRLVTPRKMRPVPVLAGSVGIAGSQGGIYPLNSPGGWQIIGRTPVRLFDPRKEMPTTLKIGDRVQFYPVTPGEFKELNNL
jgi:inhibitor of KinA